MKRTSRMVADSIMKDGVIKECHNYYIIVEAFGKVFRIEEYQSKTPKITQIK